MARLPRKANIVFGSTASGTDIEQFGSAVQLGIPNYTTDVAAIQALSSWTNGWSSALVVANQSAYKQDMNAIFYVLSSQLSYIFQQGITEWLATTEYCATPNPSIVQANGGQWFQSLQDTNINNAPPAGASNAFWKWINPPEILDGGVSVDSVPRVSAASPGKLVDGALTDDGSFVKTTLPLKFPDNTTQATAAVNAAVSVQNVVTGSRAVNTVFQNTSSKPIFVSVVVTQAGGGTSAITDTNLAPITSVAAVTHDGAGSAETVFFIVLPGSYYKIVSPGGALSGWVEWS